MNKDYYYYYCYFKELFIHINTEKKAGVNKKGIQIKCWWFFQAEGIVYGKGDFHSVMKNKRCLDMEIYKKQ